MAIQTLRVQILVCGVVLVAMAQQGRASSFQVTGVTPPAAYSRLSALGCIPAIALQAHVRERTAALEQAQVVEKHAHIEMG
jgi:hypothetical protein